MALVPLGSVQTREPHLDRFPVDGDRERVAVDDRNDLAIDGLRRRRSSEGARRRFGRALVRGAAGEQDRGQEETARRAARAAMATRSHVPENGGA